MLRSCTLFVLVGISTFALAQNSSVSGTSASQPSTKMQVVYVVDNSTLTTYNVDPQTFVPTEAGTLTLKESVYPNIVPSPNDRFFYYTAFENYSQQGQKLYVYDTNSLGVPATEAVQTIAVSRLFGGIVIDAVSKFVYVASEGTPGSNTTPWYIYRFVLDPATGKLSQRVTEATYSLQSNVEVCDLSIMGLNAAGTELYDGIGCINPEGTSATYNQRSVNVQTGALGADVQIYSSSDYNGGSERVQFVKNLMFDFVSPNNPSGQTGELVNVYRIKPNETTPTISCGSSMFDACGDFILGLVNPTAKYVFLTNPQSVTEIGAVNLSTQQITETSSIPYEVQEFSPDGTIAYAANDAGTALEIEIYGFNLASGAVTQGGVINVPSDLDSWVTAERY